MGIDSCKEFGQTQNTLAGLKCLGGDIKQGLATQADKASKALGEIFGGKDLGKDLYKCGNTSFLSRGNIVDERCYDK